jgi:hypothetical protein
MIPRIPVFIFLIVFLLLNSVASAQSNTSSVVSRLPEAQRREIFNAVVQLQEEAWNKAKAKYPMDTSKTTLKDALFQLNKEEERLRNRYEQSLRRKYKLSEKELEKIKVEGLEKKWGFP